MGKQNATKNLLETQLLFELSLLCTRFLGTFNMFTQKGSVFRQKGKRPSLSISLNFWSCSSRSRWCRENDGLHFLFAPKTPFYICGPVYSVCLSSSLWSEYCVSLLKPLPSAPMWPLMSLHPFPSCLLVLFTWLCGCTFKIINPNRSQLLCGAVRCARTRVDPRVWVCFRRVLIGIWTRSENSECSRRELHTEDQSSFLFLTTPLTSSSFNNSPYLHQSPFSFCFHFFLKWKQMGF